MHIIAVLQGQLTSVLLFSVFGLSRLGDSFLWVSIFSSWVSSFFITLGGTMPTAFSGKQQIFNFYNWSVRKYIQEYVGFVFEIS